MKYLMTIKCLQTNFFFFVLIKSLNWEVLTKNLVTLKRWDGATD